MPKLNTGNPRVDGVTLVQNGAPTSDLLERIMAALQANGAMQPQVAAPPAAPPATKEKKARKADSPQTTANNTVAPATIIVNGVAYQQQSDGSLKPNLAKKKGGFYGPDRVLAEWAGARDGVAIRARRSAFEGKRGDIVTGFALDATWTRRDGTSGRDCKWFVSDSSLGDFLLFAEEVRKATNK